MNVWDLLISAKDTKEEEDEQDIKKACIWLKEAGFPQYVQMFNDSEFPISLKLVQEDHMDFDGGSLMALFRRIEILNKASEIKSALFTEDLSTKITESISSFQKPYYEIIEDNSDNEVENENEENEDEDDDDKENVLEQTALSSNWSYEPRTRRWSHIELAKPPTVNRSEQNIPKLENYLGVSFPRPFVTIPEDNSSDNYQKSYQFKRPNCLLESHRSFEPIIESNPENNDPLLNEDNQDLDNLMKSLQIKNKSPISPNDNQSPTALSPTSPDSNRDSLKVDKPNNHILRSASMRLMKAVSRINPNQLSLRHKKDNVISSPNPTSVANDDDLSIVKIPTPNEEIDFAKLKLPDKSNEFPRESYPIGDSGWLNGRTGSFISRNSGQSDAEFKTQKKNIICDLDPVISLLESDVNSLEVMRSRIKSRASPDSAPTSPVLRHKSTKHIIKKDQQRLSDFESYTRYDNDGNIKFNDNIGSDTRISSPSAIDQSVLKKDDDDWALSSKINRHNVTRWSHTSYSKDKSNLQYHHLLELSVTKFNLLKKFSILSCTSLLEKHCPQKNVFNWRIPRLLPQKQKLSFENTNFIFGVNLSVIQNRFGQPFPPVILNVFNYLRKHGPTTQGIFRKTGMKCRIKELKIEMEKDENLNNFDGYNVNDVADILKTYFRDLPDRLLTNKLSSTLLAIYNYVPKESQCEGLKWALFSLPDENRVALEYLIEFLSYLSNFSDVTKMDAKNLSLCFAPSLFNFQNDGSSNNTMSPLRMKKSNGPNNKHLAEQNAAHLCVASMINNTSSLFQITHESLKMGSFNAPDKSESNDVTHIMSANLRQEWIRNKMQQLKADTNVNKTGWTNINKDFIKKVHGPNAVIEQLSYRKIGSHHNNTDGIALRTWKVVIDIEVSPGYLFSYIKDKRHLWDPDVSQMEPIKDINEYIECVKFVSDNPDGSFVPRQFNILRGHQLGVNGSAHMIFAESMNDELFITTNDNYGSVSKYSDILIGHIYCDNFLIEAVSMKLTKVTWISRVDLGGHHSDWYSNHWGHNMIRRAAQLKYFAKENSSLRLSSESSINNFSDSALSPGKDNSSPSINPQIFECAPETTL